MARITRRLQRALQVLQKYRSCRMKHRDPGDGGASDGDKLVRLSARKVRNFLSQPFCRRAVHWNSK